MCRHKEPYGKQIFKFVECDESILNILGDYNIVLSKLQNYIENSKYNSGERSLMNIRPYSEKLELVMIENEEKVLFSHCVKDYDYRFYNRVLKELSTANNESSSTSVMFNKYTIVKVINIIRSCWIEMEEELKTSELVKDIKEEVNTDASNQ